jgi:predicted DNA-binding transcriptional regulator YafY
MAKNKLALLRYKTIDNCLQNKLRKWTLEDLIDAVSDALYKYEGIEQGVSKRTIQLDIQIMRSDELGYNAPIIIINKKYYSYDDNEYSITKSAISMPDIEKLQDVVSVLKQFKGFGFFQEIGSLVEKLESKVLQQNETKNAIIQFEKNDLLKGLEYLDELIAAVKNKQAINILYKSFKAKQASEILVSPYLLKEYRNRWFLLCINHSRKEIMNLALDRMEGITIAEKTKFHPPKDFDAYSFFDDAIGVTKSVKQKPVGVILKITAQHAPYILTKPIHSSQQVLKIDTNFTLIKLTVIHNFELEREIMGFAENMEVLAPKFLRKKIMSKMKLMKEIYKKEEYIL